MRKSIREKKHLKKDFKIRCIDRRRYGSDRYSWYEVEHIPTGFKYSNFDPVVNGIKKEDKDMFLSVTIREMELNSD